MRIKELAHEAKLIRHEAKRHPAWACLLHDHRKDIVRPAAREAQLAYAFLRGVPYRRVEAKCHEQPNWAQVKRLACKFGWAEWGRRKTQMELSVDEWATAD